MIKVFISYKTNDLTVARRVRDAIDRHDDFKSYLDRIDDAVLRDGPDLADHLLKRIDQCDQLLAVVGRTTKLSWWVPWEIGVGSEKNYFLATYSEEDVQLPSYLKTWPALHSKPDVDRYCQMSRRRRRNLEVATEEVYLAEEVTATRRRHAADFHRDLRRALRQV